MGAGSRGFCRLSLHDGHRGVLPFAGRELLCLFQSPVAAPAAVSEHTSPAAEDAPALPRRTGWHQGWQPGKGQPWSLPARPHHSPQAHACPHSRQATELAKPRTESSRAGGEGAPPEGDSWRPAEKGVQKQAAELPPPHETLCPCHRVWFAPQASGLQLRGTTASPRLHQIASEQSNVGQESQPHKFRIKQSLTSTQGCIPGAQVWKGPRQGNPPLACPESGPLSALASSPYLESGEGLQHSPSWTPHGGIRVWASQPLVSWLPASVLSWSWQGGGSRVWAPASVGQGARKAAHTPGPPSEKQSSALGG